MNQRNNKIYIAFRFLTTGKFERVLRKLITAFL